MTATAAAIHTRDDGVATGCFFEVVTLNGGATPNVVLAWGEPAARSADVGGCEPAAVGGCEPAADESDASAGGLVGERFVIVPGTVDGNRDEVLGGCEMWRASTGGCDIDREGGGCEVNRASATALASTCDPGGCDVCRGSFEPCVTGVAATGGPCRMSTMTGPEIGSGGCRRGSDIGGCVM